MTIDADSPSLRHRPASLRSANRCNWTPTRSLWSGFAHVILDRGIWLNRTHYEASLATTKMLVFPASAERSEGASDAWEDSDADVLSEVEVEEDPGDGV